MRKKGPHPPTTSGSYGKQAGTQVHEIQVEFEIFEILYRLNYSGFYFVYYHCNVTTVLVVHFSWLLSSKAYFKVCFEVQKISSHF